MENKIAEIKRKLIEIKTGLTEIVNMSEYDMIDKLDEDAQYILNDINRFYDIFVEIHRLFKIPPTLEESKKRRNNMLRKILTEKANEQKSPDSFDDDIHGIAQKITKLKSELESAGVHLYSDLLKKMYSSLVKITPVKIDLVEDIKIDVDASDQEKEEATDMATKTKQDVKLVTEANDQEKKYKIFLKGNIWAKDDDNAIEMGEKLKNNLNQHQDGSFKMEIWTADLKHDNKEVFKEGYTIVESMSSKDFLNLLNISEKYKIGKVTNAKNFLNEIKK